MLRRSCRHFILAAAFLVVGRAIMATEVVYLPFSKSKGEVYYSQFYVYSLDLWHGWLIDGPTHTEILKKGKILYDFYRKLPHFTDEEVDAMEARDLSEAPGFYAYIVSFVPQTEIVRGISRLAFSHRPVIRQFGWLQEKGGPKTQLLPVAQKYDAEEGKLGNFIEQNYPGEKVEWGRTWADHPTKAGRVHIMVQNVRAGLVFLNEVAPKSWSIAESAAEETTRMFKTLGMEENREAPLPPNRSLLAAKTNKGLNQLIRPIEDGLRCPRHIDPFTHSACTDSLANLEQTSASLPKAVRRSMGGYSYYRTLFFIRLGRFDEARAELQVMSELFGKEPDLLSLQLYAEAVSRVNFWTLQGDTEGLRQYLNSQWAIEEYDRSRLREGGLDERLFWLSFNELAAGNIARAVELRNQLVLPGSNDLGAAIVALESMAIDKSSYLRSNLAKGVPLSEILNEAMFHYQQPVSSLGLSATFNFTCAELLEKAGNPLAEHFLNRAVWLSNR